MEKKVKDLTLNEVKHKAMEKKVKDLTLNEVKNIAKQVLLEGHTKTFYIDHKFETPEGAEFIITGTVEYSDEGIGGYDYHGSFSRNENWVFHTEDFELKGGSFQPEDRDQILEWIRYHGREIEEALEDAAKREHGWD